MKLTSMKCVLCEGGVKPFSRKKALGFLKQVKGWGLVNNGKAIEKEIVFKDFKIALGFVNAVGGLAEKERHHPDILLYRYKHVRVSSCTHAVGGLSVNDFILAAKIDLIK